jgi:hypothetical protein
MADPIASLIGSLNKIANISHPKFQKLVAGGGDECEALLQKLRNVMISHRTRAGEEVLSTRLLNTAAENIEVSQPLLTCALALLIHTCSLPLLACSTCASS